MLQDSVKSFPRCKRGNWEEESKLKACVVKAFGSILWLEWELRMIAPIKCSILPLLILKSLVIICKKGKKQGLGISEHFRKYVPLLWKISCEYGLQRAAKKRAHLRTDLHFIWCRLEFLNLCCMRISNSSILSNGKQLCRVCDSIWGNLF